MAHYYNFPVFSYYIKYANKNISLNLNCTKKNAMAKM